MTFIAPASSAEARMTLSTFGRRTVKPRGRLLLGDEDVARRALGGDGRMPLASVAGASIEDLARIALG